MPQQKNHPRSMGPPAYQAGQEQTQTLTLRWDRRNKRWRAEGVSVWYDGKERKWSCRCGDGTCYYGFSSLRRLLKSYVGGLLCRSLPWCPTKLLRVRYHFTRCPRRVSCRVTLRSLAALPMQEELL